MIANPQLHEITTEVIKASPPVAVTGMLIAGVSVSDWAAILTVIYVILQIFFLLRSKMSKPLRAKKPATKAPEAKDAP